MDKYKLVGKDLYSNVKGNYIRIKTFETEEQAQKDFDKRMDQDRKFRALQKDLFVPKEIQGLFGSRGGLWDINIESEKMLKFRKDVHDSRRKMFSNLMKEEISKGKDKVQSFNDAYVRFMDIAENENLVLTQQKFQELYPDERRQKLSW